MVLGISPSPVVAQERLSDSAWTAARKNIVRYNLSSAAVFGFDNAIIFGYERLLSPKQSFSINIGQAGLPKVLQLETDSFRLGSNQVNSDLNLSADYRFYLAKENRYPAPRGSVYRSFLCIQPVEAGKRLGVHRYGYPAARGKY
jgi:hypothetical protein